MQELLDLLIHDAPVEIKPAGITTGIVTDITDPDGQNRIKVKLQNRSDLAQETDYIRVMTSRAGEGYGIVCLPEVGDEVVVAFLNGDITMPLVIGCLMGETRKPPVVLAEGKNEVQMLKSKLGHLVTIEDGSEVTGITVQTAEGLLFKLDDKNKQVQLSDKDGKNALTFDLSSNTVSLLADAKIVLKAGSASIELDGQGNAVTINSSGNIVISGQQVSIEGKSAVNIKASGQLNLEASGIANLKGSMTKIN